ncbi:MAG: hypothetical protein ACJASF_001553 [Vicingaceae bacterium]|jgi:hypothetical protein
MRILSVLAFLLVNLSSFFVVGQIQTGELPPSFLNAFEKSGANAYTVQIADPNVESKRAEDAITDEHKDIAWRFGALVPVNYNLANAGEWSHDDDNGSSTWKLEISFHHAKSINLNFNNFQLSSNARLFVYNENYTDILGAITARNNKKDQLFSIRPIKGSSITLELTIPQDEIEQNTVSINEVVYGYRSIHDKVQKVFQSSGNCNINVNCEEGKSWQDVKRAVAMVTTVNNTRFCTATLINNVRQDTTPYILGAAHCGLRSNSIFIFGYESALCSPNADGVLSNSISGSARKAVAVNFGSDFELRELSNSPPASYNVYYAGWNNQNVASTKSVGIHHPTGDVKKISIDENILTNSGYYSAGVTHWQVSNWEIGTTESGSSGSSLFDANQRIIGQLHGGDASCNNRLQDYYGKFSYSWNTSSDTLRQLKHWLDPDNTGAFVLDGLDPNSAPFNSDLALLDIDGIPEFECTQGVQATFRVKNIGNNNVDSFYVDYKLNGNPVQSIRYANNTNRQQIVTLNSPTLSPINGVNKLLVTARTAGIIDQNGSNNTDSIVFTINTSVSDYIYLRFKSDDYGSETSWQLEDLNNSKVLHLSPGYPDISGGAIYNDSLCAYSGCFRFSIFDSQNDGFNDPSGSFGNGYLLITNSLSDTLFFENNFRTALSTDTFCVQFSTSLNERLSKDNVLSVFPNPIHAGETLRLNSSINFSLRLRNVQGQLVTEAQGNQFNIPEKLTSGIYFLEIRELKNNSIVDIKKVLIQ